MDLSALFLIAKIDRACRSADDLEKQVRTAITSHEFSYICVPLIFVGLGILAKWLGRREQDTAPHRNELAVGTSVLVMTTGKIFADLCAPSPHIATSGAWAFFTLLMVITSSGVDRHFSWEKEGLLMTNRKRWWRGIILPNLLATCIFALYQYMKIVFQ